MFYEVVTIEIDLSGFQAPHGCVLSKHPGMRFYTQRSGGECRSFRFLGGPAKLLGFQADFGPCICNRSSDSLRLAAKSIDLNTPAMS
jgi:hypothetical protein